MTENLRVYPLPGMGLKKLFNQKIPHDDKRNNVQGFVYHRIGINNGNLTENLRVYVWA